MVFISVREGVGTGFFRKKPYRRIYRTRLAIYKSAAKQAIADKLDYLCERYVQDKQFITHSYDYYVDFLLPRPRFLCIDIRPERPLTEEESQLDSKKKLHLDLKQYKRLVLTKQQALTISPDALRDLLNALR